MDTESALSELLDTTMWITWHLRPLVKWININSSPKLLYLPVNKCSMYEYTNFHAHSLHTGAQNEKLLQNFKCAKFYPVNYLTFSNAHNSLNTHQKRFWFFASQRKGCKLVLQSIFVLCEYFSVLVEPIELKIMCKSWITWRGFAHIQVMKQHMT